MNSEEKQGARMRVLLPVNKDNLRRAALDVLGMAKDILGVGKDGWEAPEEGRKLWKRKNPDGTYEYRPDPPDGKATKDDKPKSKSPPKLENKPSGDSPKQDEKSEVRKKVEEKLEEKKTTEKKPVVYKQHLRLDKAKLQETLTKGYFSVISAGRNPNDSKEAVMSPDDEFFHKRHIQLQDELEKHGLQYTEVVGHYGGKESSFLVFHDGTDGTPKTVKSMMVHHKDKDEAGDHRKIVEELGRKFNQDSVLCGSAGRNEIVFTSGKKKGQTCGGNGWKEVPEAKDFYTDIKLEGKKHTKFNLDIHECFERGLL